MFDNYFSFYYQNSMTAKNKIQDICKTFSLRNSNQEQNLIESLKTNCRKTIKEKTGKRPYTNINLVRL